LQNSPSRSQSNRIFCKRPRKSPASRQYCFATGHPTILPLAPLFGVTIPLGMTWKKHFFPPPFSGASHWLNQTWTPNTPYEKSFTQAPYATINSGKLPPFYPFLASALFQLATLSPPLVVMPLTPLVLLRGIRGETLRVSSGHFGFR